MIPKTERKSIPTSASVMLTMSCNLMFLQVDTITHLLDTLMRHLGSTLQTCGALKTAIEVREALLCTH